MMNHLLLQLNVRFIEQVYQYTKGMKEIYLIRSFFMKTRHFKSEMPELPENHTIIPAKCGKPEFPSNKLQSESFFPSESEARNEATAWLDAL